MWWFWSATGWMVFVTWLMALGPSVFQLRRRRLRLLQSVKAESLSQLPTVSVIIPARNEEAAIERCLRSLLASDYPSIEFIAIDDRSDDATGEIMDRLAAQDDRLRIIHITELPDDWLGKNHALHVGAQAATGEILLFTDGDVLFDPDAIRLTASYLVQHELDHLCLVPHIVHDGYWESALIGCFVLLFVSGTQPWLASTPLRRVYVGVGAFNMVRRSSYEKSGGHEAIRLDVIDDVKIGKLLKQSGFRQDVLMGDDLLHVRWQSSAWNVITGLEKNAFAAVHYSLCRLVVVTCILTVFMVLPYGMAFSVPGTGRLGWCATVVLLHLMYGFVGATFGAGWRVFPVLPITTFGMLFAFWRSAAITLRQGGIRWRDTFYPLSQLKANIL